LGQQLIFGVYKVKFCGLGEGIEFLLVSFELLLVSFELLEFG
jgi:hypothetical protein